MLRRSCLQFVLLTAFDGKTQDLEWRSQTATRQVAEEAMYQGQQLLDWLRRLVNWQSQPDLGALPDWLEPLVIWLTRGLVILLVGLLLLGLVRLVWLRLRRWRTRLHPPAKAEPLPLATALSLRQWLDLAQQAQAQEDYATACRALYMALLLRLEAGGWLTLDPARTNRDYLQVLESLWVLGHRPGYLRDGFYQIFQTHDRLYYGKYPIPVDIWQRCHSAYQNLEAHLLQHPPAP